MILEVSENLAIMVLNILIYYLIIKVSYVGSLLIIKLMFISIGFEVLRKISCTYDGLVKPRKETRPSQCILK